MKTSTIERGRVLLAAVVVCGGTLLTVPTIGRGDVLVLSDGTVVQGIVLSKSSNKVYVKDRQGEYRHYAVSDIKRLEWHGVVETEGQIRSIRYPEKAADMTVPMNTGKRLIPKAESATVDIVADSGQRLTVTEGGSIPDPNWLAGPFREIVPVSTKAVSAKPISSLGVRTYKTFRKSKESSDTTRATSNSSGMQRGARSMAEASGTYRSSDTPRSSKTKSSRYSRRSNRSQDDPTGPSGRRMSQRVYMPSKAQIRSGRVDIPDSWNYFTYGPR